MVVTRAIQRYTPKYTTFRLFFFLNNKLHTVFLLFLAVEGVVPGLGKLQASPGERGSGR